MSIFSLALSIIPERARATTLYVGGSDPGNYTAIQAAIDDAIPGDTVFVYNGTYMENLIIGKTMSLVGEDRETTEIRGLSFGDVVYVTADWVNITGFTIRISGMDWYDAGIELDSVQECFIANNRVSDNSLGINLYLTNNTTVTGNIASDNQMGINLLYSDNNAVADNNMSNYYAGITLDSSRNNTLVNNTMVGDGVQLLGDFLEEWNSHTIDTSNTVNGSPVYYLKDLASGSAPQGGGQVILANCTGLLVDNQSIGDAAVGIQMGFSSNNTVLNNTVFSNNFHGIYISHSSENWVVGNTASSNEWHGIYIDTSSNNTIAGNVVQDNWGDGISLTSCSDEIVVNNTAIDNSDGISLYSSTGNHVIDNIPSGNYAGIYLRSSTGNSVSGNNASGNWVGINVDRSDENTVTGNVVPSNDNRGIALKYSSNNTVINNTMTSNGWIGILLSSSTYNTFRNNTMIGNGISVLGATLGQWNTHVVDTSNTVNGTPLHYWEDIVGGKVPPDAGQVILANCTDVVVENQNLTSASIGIQVAFSANITIANSTISSNNYFGMFVLGSIDNTITNNSISLNPRFGIYVDGYGNNTINGNVIVKSDYGVYLDYAGENAIFNNSISENRYALYLNYQCHDNVIENNRLSLSNQYGIRVRFSDGNSIVDNDVTDNGHGISLYNSNGNEVYHNNIIDNAVQASDDGPNRWNDSYPSGGNFWSDYAGVDDCSGPNQNNCPDRDGIGDTPYDVDADTQDRYPLMLPRGTPHPRPPNALSSRLSGKDSENVTLNWSLSPDDGIGTGTVIGYEVHRHTTYDPEGLGYQLHASLPNGTSNFVDNYTGEGDPNNYFYRVCAVDAYDNRTCGSNQAAKFTRPLTLGPNLASVPLLQFNESVETVLQTVEYDRAWYYDSLSQEWKWYMKYKEYRRELWKMNQTVGLWVNVTEDSNLTVAGPLPAQTSIHQATGWNLISFPSFNTAYTVADLKAELPVERVEGFDASAPPHFLRVLQDSDVLQAGEGYWVKVSADATWILFNG